MVPVSLANLMRFKSFFFLMENIILLFLRIIFLFIFNFDRQNYELIFSKLISEFKINNHTKILKKILEET